ncbi:MAG: TylF/MycF/NovP-related O-methyltransferase [Candidatus Hinthialibacter antarcticus]|nr:TylF/MycF/NovP-related O-methyltransferase [Candidatus Hinthialibacter antarcticus]
MKKLSEHDAIVLSSGDELDAQGHLAQLLKSTAVPDSELLANLGLYLTSKNLSRLLFFYEIYQRILPLHGVVMEFGVRWGQTLSLLSALRGILEPFNRHRKIIGFDTFAGFQGVDEKDGERCQCKDGSFSVPENYQSTLERILSIQEQLNPMAHVKRFELIAGDAVQTIPEYFKAHPETIVSMAIFDFDIYRPTKAALEAVKPHLSRGSVLIFDELCDDIFPGETVALKEVFDLSELRIERLPMTSRISFVQLGT